MSANRPRLKDSLSGARELLGWKLVHETPEGLTSGMIVETEAYHSDDPASHTFRGPTKRNAAMFGPGGHAYIYFTYGMHYCFNVVTGRAGEGQGALIRALEPLEGMALMRQRRGGVIDRQLTNGPAKLVQAMGITMRDYGKGLLSGGRLRLEPHTVIKPEDIVQTTRIGIKLNVEAPARFYVRDNPFVSRK